LPDPAVREKKPRYLLRDVPPDDTRRTRTSNHVLGNMYSDSKEWYLDAYVIQLFTKTEENPGS